MLSHPEELFSEDAILELFRLLLSPTICERYTCVPRHLRRVHWNQWGRSQGKLSDILEKNADDMWKYSLLKREWHGLTSRVSKLDQHLYFDSRCLRTSETVIEQDLKRTRMSLSRTIHIHHLCKVTCHKWQHSASRQSTGVVLYKTCME